MYSLVVKCDLINSDALFSLAVTRVFISSDVCFH